MGRITLFATSDCPHCTRVKGALILRRIPFVEIDLLEYPHRRNDMLSLANGLSVPQVFLNRQHVGGADDFMQLLETWDSSSSATLTPLEQYEQLVGQHADPTDPRLRIPTKQEKLRKGGTEPEILCTTRTPGNEKCIPLPNEAGKKASVLEIMLLLDSILESTDRRYNAHTYKRCFVNRDAIKAISTHFAISRHEAVEFGQLLQHRYKILDHVCGDHDFCDGGYYFFRLQCYHQPDVLNSYCVWDAEARWGRVKPECANTLLLQLSQLLNKIVTNVTDHNGLADYVRAKEDKKYPVFEEAVCELQAVDMAQMDQPTRLAFGINLYNLMITYAFIKMGIGTTSATRTAFFNKIKFNVGGHLLSFNDLENGVLRANRRHPYMMLSVPFGKDDPRAALALDELDCRIHFALNCGAKSCPPVKYFRPESVHQELRIVACAYCEQEVSLDEAKNEISVSMLFKWFEKDFCDNYKDLPQAISKFLIHEKQAILQDMIAKKKLTIKYTTYDWTANASCFEPYKASNLKSNELTPATSLASAAMTRFEGTWNCGTAHVQ